MEVSVTYETYFHRSSPSLYNISPIVFIGQIYYEETVI